MYNIVFCIMGRWPELPINYCHCHCHCQIKWFVVTSNFLQKIIIIICSDIAKKMNLPIISQGQLEIAIATKILNKSAY